MSTEAFDIKGAGRSLKGMSCWLNSLRSLALTELEEQGKQFFLWYPIFVAFGVGAYFSLSFEPPLAVGVFLFLLSAGGTFYFRNRFKPVLLIVLLVSSGFFASQIRTHVIHTPILQKEISPVMVSGTIDVIEDMGEGAGSRLTLSQVNIERLKAENTPTKIRLRLRKDPGLSVGQRIEVLAGLNPPSAPVIPGGFDFQRYLYFQQIGAVGFIYKDIKVLDETGVRHLTKLKERLRSAIATRAEEQLTYPQSGVAMALMMGRKTAIADEDAEAMRAAGLAHILAISGLHIGLFSGVLFFVSRLLMAAIPGFALRYPIKKYAALIGIASAFVYMMLAGATIPTQRAFLMTSIVFIAIIFDRSPMSLRLVAFAALCVLLIFPESLLSASFHMSFAAVTALVVFYDWIRPLWSKMHAQAGIARRIGLYVLGVCLTTLIASAATAPFALFHFQKIALYSLLANVAAMPIMAFVIMPGIVCALLLIPFNLDVLGFFILDFGVGWMLDIAHWTANLPHAVMLQPVWPLSALICLVLATLIFCLFITRYKAIALIPAFASVILICIYKQPDIVISSSFKLVGVSLSDEQFIVSNRRSEKFSRENWVRSFGIEAGTEDKWPREYTEYGGTPFICDESACRYELKGYKISYLKDVAQEEIECAYADILLSERPLNSCNTKPTIDFFDTYRHGAHAIWLNKNAPEIIASEHLRGNRPWSGLNEKF